MTEKSATLPPMIPDMLADPILHPEAARRTRQRAQIIRRIIAIGFAIIVIGIIWLVK